MISLHPFPFATLVSCHCLRWQRRVVGLLIGAGNQRRFWLNGLRGLFSRKSEPLRREDAIAIHKIVTRSSNLVLTHGIVSNLTPSMRASALVDLEKDTTNFWTQLHLAIEIGNNFGISAEIFGTTESDESQEPNLKERDYINPIQPQFNDCHQHYLNKPHCPQLNKRRGRYRHRLTFSPPQLNPAYSV